MPNTRSRKSSLGRSMSFSQRNMGTGKMADHRNIKDAQFQAEIRNDLQTFFLEQQVDFFSAKCLSNPLRQDFENMLRYLLLSLDQYLVFSASSNIFITEAYDVVKRIYPFQVSKTHFDSAGAKHSWPNLLSMLHYLMKAGIEKSAVINSTEYEEPRFEVDTKCYDLYIHNKTRELEEETADCLANEEEKIAQYEIMYETTEQEIEQVKQEIEEYHQITKHTMEEIEAVKDIEVNTELIKAKVSTVESTLKSKESVLKQMKDRIDSLTEKESEFKNNVAKQPLSKASAKKVVESSRQLKQKLEKEEMSVGKARKGQEEDVQEKQREQEKQQNIMDALVTVINAKTLVLSPLEQFLNKEGTSLEEESERPGDKLALIEIYKSSYVTKEKNEVTAKLNMVELKIKAIQAEKDTPGKLESSDKQQKMSATKEEKIKKVKQELKEEKSNNISVEKEVSSLEGEVRAELEEYEQAKKKRKREGEIAEVEKQVVLDKVAELKEGFSTLIAKCKEEFFQIQRDIEAERQRRIKLRDAQDEALAHIKKRIEKYTLTE